MIIYPLPPNENERLSALGDYNILGSGPARDFDDLTRLAAEICQTPIALVTILGEDTQWFKSNFGTELTQTSREVAFCSHSIAGNGDIMIVNNAKQDQRFIQNPLVTGHPDIVFYAGVPLINPEGFALGTLCVIDHEEKGLNESQINALKILAKQAQHQLELRRKVSELEKVNIALSESNSFIEKFAQRVAHDIKNPLASIILSAESLRKRFETEGDEKAVRLIQIALRSANNLVAYVDNMLDYSKAPSTLLEKQETIDFRLLLENLITMLNVPQDFNISMPERINIRTSKIELEQIMLNLLTNAIRYNDKDKPEIQVSCALNEDQYILTVKDNGRGISEENLEKIFFEGFTVQGHDRFNRRGNGLGLDAVSSLVGKMQGSIKVDSVLRQGTTVSICLPK